MLLGLELELSAPDSCFAHLSFNSTLQLIDGISKDLQNFFRYSNGTAAVGFFRIPLFHCGLSFSAF